MNDDIPESEVERERRRKEDFKFFLLAHSKGNGAMYELFRDRSLDKPLVSLSDDIERNG